MRKATFIGINNYGHPDLNLRGCNNDASAMSSQMETNGDGSPNFDCLLYTDLKRKADLYSIAQDLFNGENDIALFYFSGHGIKTKRGTYLVTPDQDQYSRGLALSDLLQLAGESKCRNKIIILDCCYSGDAGNVPMLGNDASVISKGLTILAASKPDEPSMEVNGHGIFTNLLLDALQGGAADIRGNITPGSVYSYIDKALGAHDQRPVFKTNITAFTTLRKVSPKVKDSDLRKLVTYFPTPDHYYQLDPSYEDTNSPEIKPLIREPYAKEANVSIFKILQEFQGAGLVVPVDAPYMYFAAMDTRSCKLTALGYHYWKLVKDRRV